MRHIDYKEYGIYYGDIKSEKSAQDFVGFLHNFVFPKVHEAYNDDSDYIMLITGAERTGKSNIALFITDEYYKWLHTQGLSKYSSFVDMLKHSDNYINTLKQHLGISVQDVLPILKERLQELKQHKDKYAYPFIVDEGARFYSKWRQMTREGYEVFLIYRLMGFLKMFWMILYQTITDAGEIFKTGRVRSWFYTFIYKGERYVAYIPFYQMSNILYKANVFKRYRAKLGFAHYFPNLFFSRIVKLEDVIVFKAPRFKGWQYYQDFKVMYNEDRVKMLEEYLAEDSTQIKSKKKRASP